MKAHAFDRPYPLIQETALQGVEPSRPPEKRKSLIAHWTVENGQLTCHWVTEHKGEHCLD